MQLDRIIDSRAADIIKKMDYILLGKITNIDNISSGVVSAIPKSAKFLSDYSYRYYEESIDDIPYVGLTSGNSCITLPPKIGDTVILNVCQHSLFPYKNNVDGQYEPDGFGFLNIVDAMSIGTINNKNGSDYNPVNFTNKLNPTDLNIVHNKNTENEVSLSLTSTGGVKIIANTVDAIAETINCIGSTVNVDEDVIVKGISVYDHLTQHVHKYTDDGNPMTTEKPEM